jgi:hypothetical protein
MVSVLNNHDSSGGESPGVRENGSNHGQAWLDFNGTPIELALPSSCIHEMRIEVLYVPGCPNFQPAVERLEKVLVAESLRVDIKTVPVNSDSEAKALQFPGSPTIRINDNDVEPSEMKAPGLACRLYANHTGVPSEETLRVALSRASREDGA